MELLRIFTFGGLRIQRGDTLVTGFETRKVEALLIYITSNRRVHSREVLANLLWDERSQQQTQSNLRVALSSLRKQLGEYIQIDRDTIGLNPQATIWLDASELEEALFSIHANGGIRTAQQAEQAEQAIHLYQGEFLEGFYIRESQGFDDWLVHQRERFHTLVTTTLFELVEYELQNRAYQPGYLHAARLIQLDPLMEAAYRQMMQLLAYTGQRGEALAQYEMLKRILWDELGITPSDATVDLYQKIQAGKYEEVPSGKGYIRGYEIKEQFGQGSFGVVYRGYQPQVKREVAIKVIRPEYANQPDFIRRFENEAQIIAQLEHPFIVPLYDYWRDPYGAYLVMRLMKGGSLEDLLKRGPLDLDRAALLLEQIVSALVAAHRQEVVHRDLKPANILLDAQCNAYLSDFGIAKVLGGQTDQTLDGVLLGTPGYISPEQLKGEPVSPQTDQYSLGIILYEMLAGVHPFHNSSIGEIITHHLRDQVPNLAEIRSDLPPGIGRVIQRATSKNPSDRYNHMTTLYTEFLNFIKKPENVSRHRWELSVIDEMSNPYKGLRAFQEVDAKDFFGRKRLIQRLLNRMGEEEETHRFLALVGPSGSGKSSLVKAGLLPAIRGGALPGSQNWFIVDMLPGARPLEELEVSLGRINVRKEINLAEHLWRDERGLLRAARLALPSERDEILLVIDQFEELFTLSVDKDEVRRFLELINSAVNDPSSQIRVVITLRADFYDRPLVHPGFSSLLQNRTEVVIPLTVEELEHAITGPGERVGITFEDGLITLIVADVAEQPGELPLLEYALTELFERRQGNLITRAAYQEIDGVLGALGRRAEAIFTNLDSDDQNMARQMFLRLVAPGEGMEDTRRRVSRFELLSLLSPKLGADESETRGVDQLDKVIETFGRARLFSFDRDPQTRHPTVEVAHEALIREWPRLKEWLDESRSDMRLQRALSNATTDWIEAGKDPSFLLRGARLEQLETWSQETKLALTENEAAFIHASLALRERQKAEEVERQRREFLAAHKLAEAERERADEQVQAAGRLKFRNRLITAVSIGAILFALLAFLFGLQSYRNAGKAENNRLDALANAATAQAEAKIRSTQQARAEANFTRSEAQRLAAEANRLYQAEGNVELIALLSILSLQTQYTPQGDAALHNAITLNYPVKIFNVHSDWVLDIAFLPDGNSLISVGKDKAIIQWDIKTGQLIKTYIGHKGQVNVVAVSQDGKYILTGSDDKTACLWNTQTGQQVQKYEGHESPVWGGAISADNRFVLTGSADLTARLWDLQTGKQIRMFLGHTDGVAGVAFSSDGEYILTGSLDRTARLWETRTGEKIQEFTGHSGHVRSVAFTPDDSYVITGSFDKTARLWDKNTAKVIRSFIGHTEPITKVAVSPEGKMLLTSGSDDNSARLWEIETGKELRRFQGHINYVSSVAFSPDGNTIATGSYDKTILTWELNASIKPHILVGHADQVHQVAFSPDGKYLLSGSFDHTARLWDVKSGEAVMVFRGHSGEVHGVAFSQDGKYVATARWDHTARLWNARTGKDIRTFRGHTGPVDGVAISPDLRYLITSAEDPDPTVRVWDSQTGVELMTLREHSGRVHSLVVSQDGNYILTGSTDKTTRLWDLHTGDLVRIFQIPGGSLTVAFSPKRDSFLTGSFDNTARVWDHQNGSELLRLVGHNDTVKSAVFSPDGKYILTGGTDKSARLWDASTGQEIRRFIGHIGVVNGVAYSPDGRIVATASSDSTIRLWDEDIEDSIRQLCSRLVRSFTKDELRQYDIFKPLPLCEQ